MKRKLVLFYGTLVGLFCFNLTSCVDIDLSHVSKDVQINESLVMPIGEVNFTAANLFTNFDSQGQIKFPIDTVITIVDTIKSINSVVSKISQAKLVLSFTNGLPAKFVLSLKFLNASNEVIVSSINNNTYDVNSGTLNATGFVSANTESILNIDLSSDQILQLSTAESLILTFKLNVLKESIVRETDPLNVKAEIYVKSKFSTSLGSNN